jgi:hypothetical protein
VATISTGLTVTWGSVAFTEVTDLQVSYAGGASKGRSVAWTDDAGSVSVASLGTANINTSEWGLRKHLEISGAGVSLTSYAVYEGWTAQPELNGVTRYSVTFKLLDG